MLSNLRLRIKHYNQFVISILKLSNKSRIKSGLKIRWPKGRTGSSPVSSTNWNLRRASGVRTFFVPVLRLRDLGVGI